MFCVCVCVCVCVCDGLCCSKNEASKEHPSCVVSKTDRSKRLVQVDGAN